MAWFDDYDTFADGGGGWDPWSAPNSGQVGFSGGTSGNWWDGSGVDAGSGWAYDPANDEYYRPDGDYSGGDTYPGNPYSGVTFSATGTGMADIPLIGSPSPGQLDFSGYPSGGGTGSGGGGATGGGSQFYFYDPPQRGIEQGTPVRTPGQRTPAINDPYTPTPNVNNNTTNNRTANLSQTNIASESQTNALPPIASGSPAPNPETFDPQYIPQGRRSYDPIAPAPQAESPYDYGPSRSGPDVPLGGGRTMPTSGGPSAKDAITGGIAGMTGIDFSSGKGLKDSLLGLTGVNRYKQLIQNTRKRPNQQQPRNPYDSF